MTRLDTVVWMEELEAKIIFTMRLNCFLMVICGLGLVEFNHYLTQKTFSTTVRHALNRVTEKANVTVPNGVLVMLSESD